MWLSLAYRMHGEGQSQPFAHRGGSGNLGRLGLAGKLLLAKPKAGSENHFGPLGCPGGYAGRRGQIGPLTRLLASPPRDTATLGAIRGGEPGPSLVFADCQAYLELLARQERPVFFACTGG
jgi:hypothetical protein